MQPHFRWLPLERDKAQTEATPSLGSCLMSVPFPTSAAWDEEVNGSLQERSLHD